MEVERVKSVPFGFRLHLGVRFVTIFNNKLGIAFLKLFNIFFKYFIHFPQIVRFYADFPAKWTISRKSLILLSVFELFGTF